MNPRKRERLLTSLLWGGVAAAGQYTMLFLTIMQRIHVRFPASMPEFYVDPRGPIRLTKDMGHCQLYVDDRFAHGFIDRNKAYPIPDSGKFGFRLIGSDVMADVERFRVHRIPSDKSLQQT